MRLTLICIYAHEWTLEVGTIILQKKKKNSTPRPDTTRARPRPPPAEQSIGVGERDEEASDREVHSIAFPREIGSEVR